jgi:cytochrome c biogenesis protein CcmG/thiol:disulfide interchange protein DsbE
MAELTEGRLAESLQDSQVDLEQAPETAARPGRGQFLFWRIVVIGVAVGFVVLMALRLWQTNRSEHRADGMAPPLEFTTFDGQTINLDDLVGQGVVINFWASWCDPCREEAELLEMAWRREKDNGIVFLGLDYLDQEPAAKKYLEEFDITYPNGPDLRSQAARRYGIKGVPETFFVNPEGEIIEIVIGPLASEGQLEQLLDEIRPQ